MFGVPIAAINQTIAAINKGIRKRKTGTLAKTTYVNELTDLVNSISGAALGHLNINIPRLPVCVVKITDKGQKDNTYFGLIQSGHVSTDPDEAIDRINSWEDAEVCYIWDMPNYDNTGYAYNSGDAKFIGAVVGYTETNDTPVVMLIGSTGGGGILDIRYNATTHWIQATYVDSPAEGDWVNKVQFTVCSTGSTPAEFGAY